MNQTAYLDSMMARQRGVRAAYRGLPYDVRRLSSASNVSVLSGRPLLAQLPVIMERVTSKDVIEDEPFSLVIFEGDCDWTKLQLGDVLSEYGTNALLDGATFVYAQHRPTREAIFVRTESVATITRPNAEAATDPASNTTPVTPSVTFGDYTPPGAGPNTYAGRDPATDLTLSLIAGQFSFGNGPAAQVPIGIAPVSRVGTSGGTQFAENLSQTRFYGYFPPLPGVTLQRLDRIDVPARGTSYVVQMTYANSVGLVGTVCVLEQDDQP